MPLTASDLLLPEENTDILHATENQVAEHLKVCKKPKELLDGNIYQDMLTKHAEDLSRVVANVLNAAYDQAKWPNVWKKVYLSFIPKKQCPQSQSECRNISFMPVLSKVKEFLCLNTSSVRSLYAQPVRQNRKLRFFLYQREVLYLVSILCFRFSDTSFSMKPPSPSFSLFSSDHLDSLTHCILVP